MKKHVVTVLCLLAKAVRANPAAAVTHAKLIPPGTT